MPPSHAAPALDFSLLARHSVRVLSVLDAVAELPAAVSSEVPAAQDQFVALALAAERVPAPAARKVVELAAATGGVGWGGEPDSSGECALVLQATRLAFQRLTSALRADADGTAASLAAAMEHAWDAYWSALAEPQPTRVMGIVNVTPDSFNPVGRFADPGAAAAHGLRLAAEGADILDVGGESTRPGAEPVPAAEELGRVLPVVRRLARETTIPISIDTTKAEVAAACLEAGARWVNDVSGLTFDPALAQVAAAAQAALVLMHRRGTPRTMQEHPVYGDVVADTLRFLRERIVVALEAGVLFENIVIDPGFGFGKTVAHNLDILRRLREYTSAGAPVLVGTSRKSTIGRVLGDLPPEERLEGTAATVAAAILHGAAIVRVHDVEAMRRVATMTDAIRLGAAFAG